MNEPLRHHVIIAGTGRAGTTLLVKILTQLGLPTGFEPGKTHVDDLANAGLEYDPRRSSAPYIVKKPGIAKYIDRLLVNKEVAIDHAIICMRPLEEAAASRRAVRERRLQAGASARGPGSLWRTSAPGEQETALAELFHKLICELTEHEVPMTFIHFPRYAREPSYLHQKLTPIFPDITEDGVRRACDLEVVHEQIHDYANAGSADQPQSEAEVTLERLSRNGRRQRRRRIMRHQES